MSKKPLIFVYLILSDNLFHLFQLLIVLYDFEKILGRIYKNLIELHDFLSANYKK